MEINDRQLIQRFSNGDQAAFEVLVRKHGSLVWSICRSMLWRIEDSEDAFQAVFLVLSVKSSRLESHPSITGWIHETSIRTCLSLRRKISRTREIPLTDEPILEDNEPWRTITKASEEEMLYAEIGRLPKQFREVILLCHFEGKSRSEAAQLLQRTTASVKSLLARGRQLLRKRLVQRGMVATSVLGFVLVESSAVSVASAASGTATSIASLPVVSENLIQTTITQCSTASASSLVQPVNLSSLSHGSSMPHAVAYQQVSSWSLGISKSIAFGLAALAATLLLATAIWLGGMADTARTAKQIPQPAIPPLELKILATHGESPVMAVVITQEPEQQEPEQQEEQEQEQEPDQEPATDSKSKSDTSSTEPKKDDDDTQGGSEDDLKTNTDPVEPTVNELGLVNGDLEVSQEEVPAKWAVRSKDGTVKIVLDNPKQGKRACLIQSETAGDFNGFLQKIDPTEIIGKKIRLRAAMRSSTDGKTNRAQAHMWMRIDRKGERPQPGRSAYFDNMGNRPVRSAEWKDFDIVAEVPKEAAAVTLGFFLSGEGKFWIDEVRLDIVDASTPTTGRSTPPRVAGATDGQNPDANRMKRMMQQLAQRRQKRTPVTVEKQRPGTYKITGSTEVRFTGALAAEDSQILFPLPLAYRDQVPLNYQFNVEPEKAIKSISVERDQLDNYIAKLKLRDGVNEKVQIKFVSTVLVGPSDFELPDEAILVPAKWPEETLPWLESTWCADASHKRIAEIGKKITSETKDVLQIIAAVEKEAAVIYRSANGRVKNLTAVEALDKRGSCTSCANLVAALLRACNIPTRILAGYPSWSGPLQTHYMVESYVPGYGWYPIESTRLQSPWPNSHQINVAILPIEYESEEMAGRRRCAAGGVPFLSLTEWDSTAWSLKGNIEAAPFCDHECELEKLIEQTPDEWAEQIETAKKIWAKWLATQAEPKMKNLSFQ